MRCSSISWLSNAREALSEMRVHMWKGEICWQQNMRSAFGGTFTKDKLKNLRHWRRTYVIMKPMLGLLLNAHYSKLHLSRHYLPTQWKFALVKVLFPMHSWTALAKVIEIATFTNASKIALAKAVETTLAPAKVSSKREGKFCQHVFF